MEVLESVLEICLMSFNLALYDADGNIRLDAAAQVQTLEKSYTFSGGVPAAGGTGWIVGPNSWNFYFDISVPEILPNNTWIGMLNFFIDSVNVNDTWGNNITYGYTIFEGFVRVYYVNNDSGYAPSTGYKARFKLLLFRYH